MFTILGRISRAWAALCGRAIAYEHIATTDAEADLLQLHARVTFALRYLKDIPMALADDITALGSAISNALAAKDTAAASIVQDMATANATIASLQAQLAAADQQVQALTASITPATPAVEPLPVAPTA